MFKLCFLKNRWFNLLFIHILRTDTEEKFTLVIRDETNNETITLVFSGSKSVRGVKEEVFVATDIPVRFQVWTGWPSGVTDIMVSAVFLLLVHSIEIWDSIISKLYLFL